MKQLGICLTIRLYSHFVGSGDAAGRERIMFQTVNPESVGVSSESLHSYLRFLRRCGVNMHSLLMMRGNKIFAEYYWSPFTRDFHHRMYSQTKSYVAIAIGLLEAEGKLRLTDRIVDLLPEKCTGESAEFLKTQTVEDMLTMRTGVRQSSWWFSDPDPDKTRVYLRQGSGTYPAGMLFSYDSPGSSVLTELADKLAGKPFLEYLQEKLFSKMGAFQNAQMIQTPNGVSWGASGLLCTTRDLAAMGRLLLQGGNWNGQQLIPECFVRKATSRIADNASARANNRVFGHGYGYQIWKTEQDGFAFSGMGGQLTVALPGRDFLFVCTSDNQGFASASDLMINGLFHLVTDNMRDTPMPAEPEQVQALEDMVSGLRLRYQENLCPENMAGAVDGVRYVCRENPMGITEFTFRFRENGGWLHYTNAQGEKVLPFCIGKNEFCKFPQLGYSDIRAGVHDPDSDFRYDAAVSAGWVEPGKLTLQVWIIDRYIGNMTAEFAFRGDVAAVRMHKTAEDFLEEYQGTLFAQAAQK